ncbi:hypothetical protein LXL04_023447, partial [Taraxacum kok-saghyz]
MYVKLSYPNRSSSHYTFVANYFERFELTNFSVIFNTRLHSTLIFFPICPLVLLLGVIGASFSIVIFFPFTFSFLSFYFCFSFSSFPFSFSKLFLFSNFFSFYFF